MILGLVALLCLGLARGAAADPQGLAMVNAFREHYGRGTLGYSSELEAIARAHAEDMARRGVMTHRSADGTGPGGRAKAAGYRYCRIAENVAQGYRSREEVIAAWYRSRGHRRNLLDREVTEMGLAHAGGGFWAMLLARPGC